MIRGMLIVSFIILFSDDLLAQVYFFDDFESGFGKWQVSGQDWDTTSVFSRGPGYSITDSPGGNYPAWANSTISMTSATDLTSANQPVLTFWHSFMVRNGSDFCYVEISEDFGFSWIIDTSFTGYETNLHFEQIDLSEYKSSPIMIRFRLRDNGDTYRYDGWYIDDVAITEKNTTLTTFPFTENFENGFDNWLVSGQDWDTTTVFSRGPGHSITDSPGGNYPAWANASITLKNAIDLSSTFSPVLTFWHSFMVRNASDYCYVEISEDYGFSWIIDTSFTGYETSLHFEQIDLSEYKSSPILIRFRLRDNGDTYRYYGWYIDDVAITEKNTILTPFPFTENFENGFDNWLVSGQDWDTTSVLSRSPIFAVTESKNGLYTDWENASITLKNAVDISFTDKPVLTFWHQYNVRANSDFCHLEISNDYGFNWITDTSFTGYTNNLHPAQIDLSEYKYSPIMIRFRLRDNGDTYRYDGWILDDVEIKDLGNPNQIPVIDAFSANPVSGPFPLNVSFTCTAHDPDPDGSITEFQWDFSGDGFYEDTTDTGINNYIYSETGSFNAKCRVVDDKGAVSLPQSLVINVYSTTMRVVSVPDDSAAADATFLLPIRINDVSGIAGAEFKLTYDPAVLEASNVSTTDLTSGFTLTDSVASGTVAISMARATGLAAGGGDFVNITFHVAAEAQPGATAQLTLTQAALYDADTNPIPSTPENGLFTVRQGADTTVTLEYIFIRPALDTLSKEQTASYAAFGIDSDDRTLEIDVAWDYAPVFGTPGSISPSSGHATVFTAAAAGDGLITAKYISAAGTFVDTAYVIVGNLKGDVNIDELINVPDAILGLQIAADILDPSRYQHWAADFNSNGVVNSADAIGILTESLRSLLAKPGSSFATLTGQGGTAVVYAIERFSKSSDLLSVPVFVDNRTDICGMDLTIEYNTSDFILLDITPANPSSFLVENIGRSKLSAVNLDGMLSENGEIVRLFFKPKNKTADRINLHITSLSLFDQTGNDISAVVELNDPDPIAVPEQYVLYQNYPNPFNPSTTIRYDVPVSGDVCLAVYDINGQLVRTLVKNSRDAGTYTVSWQGDDNQGRMVSSGVYFYKIVFDNSSWQAIKKMFFIK